MFMIWDKTRVMVDDWVKVRCSHACRLIECNIAEENLADRVITNVWDNVHVILDSLVDNNTNGREFTLEQMKGAWSNL